MPASQAVCPNVSAVLPASQTASRFVDLWVCPEADAFRLVCLDGAVDVGV